MNLRNLYKKWINNSWAIGFVKDGLNGVFSDSPEYIWVKNPYKDVCWFADPFILDVTDDVIILLVEEMRYEVHKGRIAKLIINRHTMCIEKMEILLEEDTHLSFPNILRINDEVYVYPENHDSGQLCLYRLTDNATRMDKVNTLINQPLTDAVITDVFGLLKMFSTCMPNANGDTLNLYSLPDDMSNPVSEVECFHNEETIVFPDKHARMAGNFFQHNGKLYRPAQDCNSTYGGAVILEKVECVNGKYIFTPIKRLTSQHPHLRNGMHTLNTYKNVVVVDVKGCESVLGRFVKQISNLKKIMLK